MAQPIEIFASLRKLTRTTKTGRTSSRVVISFEGDAPLFNPDEKTIAAPLAEALKDTITANLLEGKAPDGRPMPTISGRTRQWREDEAALGARGGEADSRYKDPQKRAEVKRKYDRDYTAPRLGTFAPKGADGPRGVVSGMLAQSPVVRASRDGKGFTVHFAGKRNRPRPGETLSAVETVFHGVPLWSQAGMWQPGMRAGMKEAADRLLLKDAGSFRKLLSEAAKTLRLIGQIGEDIGGE